MKVVRMNRLTLRLACLIMRINTRYSSTRTCLNVCPNYLWCSEAMTLKGLSIQKAGFTARHKLDLCLVTYKVNSENYIESSGYEKC